ncbi:MAG: hypothetical protein HYV63_10330 [Candidatus Schekmanbacteria bacterium]|nr:hypothetical protein [Candidatus Schekmanbacteria bacterium]
MEALTRRRHDGLAHVDERQALGQGLRHHAMYPQSRLGQAEIRDVREHQERGVLIRKSRRLQPKPAHLHRGVAGVDALEGVCAAGQEVLQTVCRHPGTLLTCHTYRLEKAAAEALDRVAAGAAFAYETAPRLVDVGDAPVPIHAHHDGGSAVKLRLNTPRREVYEMCSPRARNVDSRPQGEEHGSGRGPQPQQRPPALVDGDAQAAQGELPGRQRRDENCDKAEKQG